jgi:selenocysteine lyase/cysteine desulfurase
LGTFSYEAVSGMNAAIGYIEELGRRSQHLPLAPEEDVGRRGCMRRGMQAIRHYERTLTAYGLDVLGAVPNIKLYGVTDPDQAALRTPTFLFSMEGMRPSEVSRYLAEKSIFVRDGHMYCPRLMKTIGLGEEGAVRASLVHYNSRDEIDRLAGALKELKK